MEEQEEQEEYSGGEPGDETESPKSPTSQKKARPTRACDWCRRKKIRCDGNPCVACRQHRQECTYLTQTRKRPPKKDAKYVAKLESNLRHIESKFAEVAPEVFALYKNDAYRKESPRHQRTGSRKIEPPSDPSTVTVPASATLLADGLGVGGYLGPTSPWLFLQEARIYAARAQGHQTAIASAIPDFLRRDAIKIGPIHQEYSPVSADKRLQYFNVISQLIHSAWFNYGKSLHGCLHRPTFENLIATYLNGNRNGTSIYHETWVLFHVVLGLGACVLGETDRADHYVRVAFSNLVHQLFFSQSLRTVQAAYLMANLLYMLGRYSTAYNILGHGIRLAVSIGMHRTSNVSRQDDIVLNFIEIQERKRTFWGMYFLDTFLSVLLGRPPSIRGSDIDVELPEAKPDSKIGQDGLLPDDMDEQPEYFVYEPLRNLCAIIRQIIVELYSTQISKDRHLTDLSNTIGSVGGDLASWRVSLPTEHLPFGTAENPDRFAGALPFQLYFSLAYYFCQCLVYRPALVEATHRSVDGQEGGSQRGQAARQASVKQYINPLQPDPWNEEMELLTGRSTTAARDLLNLLQRGGFSMATQHFFLYPCALSASSILIDNLLRDPFAATAEPDLGLIHNMRQIFPADSPLIPIVEEFIGIGLTANRRIRPTPLPQIPEQSTSALFQQPNTQVQWPQFDVQDPNFLSLEMQSAYGQGYSLNPSVSPAAQYQAETSSAASTFSVPQFSGISPHLTYPFQQTENPAYTSLASVPPTPFIPQPPSPAKSSSHRRTQSRPEISSTSQWIGPGSPSRRQQQSTRPHSPIRIHHPIPIHAPPPPNQPQVTIPQQTPQSWDPNAAPLWLPETVQQEQQPTARSPQRPGHRKNPSKSQPRGGHK